MGVLTGAPPLRLMASAPPLCSHASAALLLDLSMILLQPAGKPDTTKALGPHQFHEQSYQEINHFQDFFKKQGKERGVLASALPRPIENNIAGEPKMKSTVCF